MRYRIELSIAALTDLQSIVDQIAEINPAAAIRIFHAIKDRCLSLDQLPERGIVVDFVQKHVRQVLEGRFVIRYQILEQEVQVLRIVDGRRNPAAMWDDAT